MQKTTQCTKCSSCKRIPEKKQEPFCNHCNYKLVSNREFTQLVTDIYRLYHPVNFSNLGRAIAFGAMNSSDMVNVLSFTYETRFDQYSSKPIINRNATVFQNIDSSFTDFTGSNIVLYCTEQEFIAMLKACKTSLSKQFTKGMPFVLFQHLLFYSSLTIVPDCNITENSQGDGMLWESCQDNLVHDATGKCALYAACLAWYHQLKEQCAVTRTDVPGSQKRYSYDSRQIAPYFYQKCCALAQEFRDKLGKLLLVNSREMNQSLVGMVMTYLFLS